MKQLPHCFFLLALSFVLGCGGGSGVERNNVSGSATIGGEPIVFGTIQFISRHEDDVEAPSGSATIENGEYNTSSDGQGIRKGPHEIRVTAYPSKPAVSEDETVVTETVEPICLGFSYEAVIEPPTFDITLPLEAKGFDYTKVGRQSRGNEP